MAATKLLSDNGVTSGITGYQLTGGNDGTLQLQTTTSGGTATTAMTIDTSQNVGIGTTSPSRTLDVGNGTGAKFIQVNGASSGINGGSSFLIANGGDSVGAFGNYSSIIGGTYNADPLIWAGSSRNLIFVTGGGANERMRIDSSGKVNVGPAASAIGQGVFAVYSDNAGAPATSGSSDAYITNRIRVSSVALDTGVYGSGTTWIQNRSYNNYATNYDLVLQPNGGNVGIGINAPATKLHVYGVTSQAMSVGAATKRIDIGYNTTTDIGEIHSADFGTAEKPLKISGNYIAFGTGIYSNPEVMRIDSSGNVGIGTNSPSTYFPTYYKGIAIANSDQTSVIAAYYQAGVGQGTIIRATNTAGTGATNIIFAGGSSFEYGRFDGSGNLFVGTTSGAGTWGGRLTLSTNSGTTKWEVGPYALATNFIIAAGASGGVYLAGTSATSWSAVSDERHKDIIEPITNAAEKVSSLRAVIGKYKADPEENRKSFLIAQDVLEVFPEAVDTTDPERFGLAYTDLIPLLTAAIQEQQTLIETLTQRIAALENK